MMRALSSGTPQKQLEILDGFEVIHHSIRVERARVRFMEPPLMIEAIMCCRVTLACSSGVAFRVCFVWMSGAERLGRPEFSIYYSSSDYTNKSEDHLFRMFDRFH